MAQKKNIAFDSLEARAETLSSDPLDRIAVRDFVKEVEIGAFQSERGVTQKIRFNVVLEVARTNATATDDVDLILSYDTITEAIDHQLEVERLNLLETLAERVAASLLKHPMVERVFIRIEKLDRIPGTLGIEIVRNKSNTDEMKVSGETKGSVSADPAFFFISNAEMQKALLSKWLDAIANHGKPALICLEPIAQTLPRTGVSQADHRIELLGIEQNAWALAGRDKRCIVIETRTELEHAIREGLIAVWAPSKMVLDAIDGPNSAATARELARWLSGEFGGQDIYEIGAEISNEGFVALPNTSVLNG